MPIWKSFGISKLFLNYLLNNIFLWILIRNIIYIFNETQ